MSFETNINVCNVLQSLRQQEAKWKEKLAKDKTEKTKKLAALKEKRETNFNQLKKLAELVSKFITSVQ